VPTETPTSAPTMAPRLSVYCPAGSTAPTRCAAGFFCEGFDVQLPCESGDYCPEGSSQPYPCPEGNFCLAPSQREPCFPGLNCRILLLLHISFSPLFCFRTLLKLPQTSRWFHALVGYARPAEGKAKTLHNIYRYIYIYIDILISLKPVVHAASQPILLSETRLLLSRRIHPACGGFTGLLLCGQVCDSK
jgi:hypothetical protein